MNKREAELETLKMFKRINDSSERIEMALKQSIDKEQERNYRSKVLLGIYLIICTFGTVDLLMMFLGKFL
ncbi:hypothetical protein ACR75P_08450 [Faecalicoccus pleomorphus]|uniref:hypothetical protein n=1 Tax=Faecalicoccus pleomorphus TaxID=1323 RepID=UPI003DA30B77